jgi:RecA-family ATPase
MPTDMTGPNPLNSPEPPADDAGADRNTAGPAGVFRPLLLDDLLKEHPPIIRWLWEPFIAEGTLNILAAYMKTGKTTLATALALAVAQGKPFLGFPVQQGGVLYLALEENPRDVGRRFVAFGRQPGDPIWIQPTSLPSFPRTLREIRAFIKALDIKLVIVDTLSRFWRVRDENSNAEIVRHLSPILDLAHESGVAILLIHHQRKSGGKRAEESAGDRPFSASSIRRWSLTAARAAVEMIECSSLLADTPSRQAG